MLRTAPRNETPTSTSSNRQPRTATAELPPRMLTPIGACSIRQLSIRSDEVPVSDSMTSAVSRCPPVKVIPTIIACRVRSGTVTIRGIWVSAII